MTPGLDPRVSLVSNPGEALGWTARGTAALARGDLGTAIIAFERCVACDASSPDTFADLGVLTDMAGNRLRARAHVRRAVTLAPGAGTKLRNLGILERELGRVEVGAVIVMRATATDDQDAESWRAVGDAALLVLSASLAGRAFRRAAALVPGSEFPWLGLGVARQRQNGVGDAVRALRRAMSIEPLSAPALANLAVAEHQADNRRAADRYARAAAALDPGRAIAWTCLGVPLVAEDRREEARCLYRRALQLDPDLAEPAVNLALLDLLEQDYVAGWQRFERRWRRSVYDPSASRRSAGSWNGGHAPSSRLLLWAEPEQALGDTILFARFAEMARRRVGHVAIECEQSLQPLMARVPGVDETVPHAHALGDGALEAPLMGLPRLFGTTADSIPAPIPYAFADPGAVNDWRTRLDALPGLRVGLCWRGNPRFGGDRTRSPGLVPLTPLISIPGVSVVALVKDRSPDESLPAGTYDPMPGIRDFDETAALLSALDLVVSSDTAVANLAGALGLDAWIVLQHTPDWRWMLSGEHTPWFPTLRLWRQDRPGDWTGVVRRVAKALDERRRTKPGA